MKSTGKQQPKNDKLPIHGVMLSLPEVGRFGGWICDNWKRTRYDRWQNIHTYEMIDTIEELYERFKSKEAQR